MEIWAASILLFLAALYGGRQLLLRHRMAVQARAHRALQTAREASPPFEDALGTFTCNGNAWSMSGSIRVTVYNVDRDDLPAVIDRHRAFISATVANDTTVRLAAATERVDAYNETWRKDREELSAEQLAKELTLHSIRLPKGAGDGPFLIFRAAERLFGGHGIELSLDGAYEPHPNIVPVTRTAERATR